MKYLQFTTADQTFPAGTTAAGYKLWVYNSGGTQVIDLEASAPLFPWNTSLPLGTYSVKCERRDAAGDRIGAQFLGQVEWSDSVQIAVPSGVEIVDL